eukprot:jgi/Botrbrau1/15092/Bobra.0255s0005.1
MWRARTDPCRFSRSAANLLALCLVIGVEMSTCRRVHSQSRRLLQSGAPGDLTGYITTPVPTETSPPPPSPVPLSAPASPSPPPTGFPPPPQGSPSPTSSSRAPPPPSDTSPTETPLPVATLLTPPPSPSPPPATIRKSAAGATSTPPAAPPPAAPGMFSPVVDLVASPFRLLWGGLGTFVGVVESFFKWIPAPFQGVATDMIANLARDGVSLGQWATDVISNAFKGVLGAATGQFDFIGFIMGIIPGVITFPSLPG